ncbi:MAG TPA: Gfo/Idh/MocA family oxidoreductase [Tepidisphaeraceae bacterium]|jgi:predicted dehydrogenase|nr:Gfo/Idh/MocA family oxidoreductase [Tepidisphaeraceae bacterium]
MAGLKALLVGAGGMGQAWAKNLRDCADVQTVGWMDIRPGAAAEAMEKLKISGVKPYDDLSKSLSELRPDFLVDVTIPEAHHDVTLAALGAGVAVLGEKPMADSMAAAREMVAASEAAGKLYMVSQSRRYDARVLAFRKAIDQHAGPLGILTSDFFLGPHFGGFREQMNSPLLLDMAIHTFDNARQISGADPLAVYCHEHNPAWSWYQSGSSATAVFEMTGGLQYTYRGSWCAQGLNTSWQSEWRAFGRRGAATWDGEHDPVAAHVTSGEGFIPSTEKITVKSDENVPSGIAGSLREFLHALPTGRTPQGECHDNIKSLAMVFAAIESAQTGRRVHIPT